MGDMQVYIVPLGGTLNLSTSTKLDNDSWRRIHDSYGVSTGGDGLKAFGISFTVEGSTPEELQTRWNATVDAFTLRDAALYATLDDAVTSGTGQWLEKILPWDGRHGHTQSFITLNEAHAQTSHCLFATLWIKTEALMGASGNGSAGIAGMDDANFNLTVSYSAGREVGRVLTCRWVPTGTSTNGLAAYTANRTSLLTTYLKTSSTGSRDSTSGMALTAENIEQDTTDANIVTVTLQSTYMATALLTHAAIRSFDCNIRQVVTDKFHTGGGPTPTIYHCSATLDISKDIYTSQLHPFFEQQVKSEFEIYIRSETQEAHITAIAGPTVVSNKRTGKVYVEAVYQGNNRTTISYSEKRSESTLADYVRNRDSAGYDGLQRPAGAPPKFVTIQKIRIGTDDALPTFTTPTEAGYSYIEAGFDYSVEGPNDTPFGDAIFETVAVARYERVRLRDGVTSGGFENPFAGGIEQGPLIPTIG